MNILSEIRKIIEKYDSDGVICDDGWCPVKEDLENLARKIEMNSKFIYYLKYQDNENNWNTLSNTFNSIVDARIWSVNNWRDNWKKIEVVVNSIEKPYNCENCKEHSGLKYLTQNRPCINCAKNVYNFNNGPGYINGKEVSNSFWVNRYVCKESEENDEFITIEETKEEKSENKEEFCVL